MLSFLRSIPVLAQARSVWRRSLQARVVSITLVSSGVLVLTFGLLLSSQITDGLVKAREDSAVATVRSESQQARSQLDSLISSPGDTDAAANVELILQSIRERLGNGVDVQILSQDATTRGLRTVDVVVPRALQDAVRNPGFADQRVMMDLGHGAGPQLYLVVGQRLGQHWGTVQIYFFFPLQAEVELASHFSNVIAVAGLALVLMLGLLAYLVTRMVVSPVRVAARTAQRLSNGLLDQRMEVNGEDDLAALAASFNQMAENLQRHILRLEEMSRLQRRFTSDVSHELRTPLTTVRMAADLIFSEREAFEPPVARSAELLQAELDRFEALLAELLEISRFDAGFASLDAEPAAIGPLVERAVERLAPVAERAGVTVEVDLPIEPVVAEVDVRRVERILRNLIGNAIEHSEGRPVKVRLAMREGAVAVTVRDQGVGLKPGEEKLVFNRFWRADPSRARHTGGTGLGLSISNEDARLHGGWLEAWGAPGQGAQFRLTLPGQAGDRLSSSPLRLVPTDFRPPTEFIAPHAEELPHQRSPSSPSGSPADSRARPAAHDSAVSARTDGARTDGARTDGARTDGARTDGGGGGGDLVVPGPGGHERRRAR